MRGINIVQVALLGIGAGLTMPPPFGLAKDTVPEQTSPLLKERDDLNRAVHEMENFRESMVGRYTDLGDRIERLLKEHDKSISNDSRSLDEVMRQGSDIGARLALRLEELKDRKAAQDHQETALKQRFDGLTDEYKDAQGEHAHYSKRTKEEEQKIERFKESAAELMKELEAAFKEYQEARSDYWSRGI